MNEIEKIVKKLQLTPHPEGGFYKETYRSDGEIDQSNLDNGYIGNRNYATGIYFLLTSTDFSAFHKIKQDEMWHFYQGSPIRVHMITSEGVYTNVVIGNNIEQDESPQYVVKGGIWFATEVVNSNAYALVGCTVAPGFDFRDFEIPSRQKLIQKFPQHEKVITKLTR